MTDIKPDTSLYTDQGDRFRALALIADGFKAGKRMQARSTVVKDARWIDLVHEAPCHPDYDCRLAPETRVLWGHYNHDGVLFSTSLFEEKARPGCTVVRFVEQPE